MSAASASPPRIAIVEDDGSLLGALAFALEAEGYQVQTYAEAAPLLVAPPAADCLVIDQKLPDMDGISLIGRLRALGVTTPAILITTGPDRRCVQAAAEAAVPIVEKPLVDGRLRRAIETALLLNRS